MHQNAKQGRLQKGENDAKEPVKKNKRLTKPIRKSQSINICILFIYMYKLQFRKPKYAGLVPAQQTTPLKGAQWHLVKPIVIGKSVLVLHPSGEATRPELLTPPSRKRDGESIAHHGSHFRRSSRWCYCSCCLLTCPNTGA
jgi:hypothetical protein